MKGNLDFGPQSGPYLLLRTDADEETIAQAIQQSIAAKKEGHEINTARFIQPDRPMYSIGG